MNIQGTSTVSEVSYPGLDELEVTARQASCEVRSQEVSQGRSQLKVQLGLRRFAQFYLLGVSRRSFLAMWVSPEGPHGYEWVAPHHRGVVRDQGPQKWHSIIFTIFL